MLNIRKIFCWHLWINILRLEGSVVTKKYGSFAIKRPVYVDYCPKCGAIRGRHEG